MNILASFNQENVSDKQAKRLRHRRAVRGIAYDKDGNIAMIHAKNEGYYTLPGGGVKPEETFEQGIIRECKEEIGCDVQIIRYIGTTVEYRSNEGSTSESSGYILNVVGQKGSPILVGDESDAEKNSVVEWTTIDDAIKAMESIPWPSDLYIQNVISRDIVFLKTAKEQPSNLVYSER